MNLVIDIGNTRSKYAFFQEDRLIGVNYRLDSILEDIRVWKEKGEKVWIFLTGSGHIDSEMQLAIKDVYKRQMLFRIWAGTGILSCYWWPVPWRSSLLDSRQRKNNI